MRRAVIFALGHFALFALASPVWSAEEPTGFAEFPWGTPRTDLMVPCTFPGRAYQTPGVRPFEVPARAPDVLSLGSGVARLTCGRSIPIGGASWNPQLTFVEDCLAGYKITVRTSAYRELLAIATEKFGAPDRETARTYRTRRGTDVSAQTHEWSWPSGTAAYLEELCSATDLSCLNVMSKSLHDWLATQRVEERERAKKGF